MMCQNEAFSRNHTFTSLDASGDVGTYRKADPLTMTWTSGPAAGDVLKARFRMTDSHYVGRFFFSQASIPALLVPAGTVACSTVSSAPTRSFIVLDQSDTDVATVQALGGQPTGTVSFSVCGPDATAAPCTPAAGTALGSPVALAGAIVSPEGVWTATATSAAFSPSATGTYCFVAVYSGDSHYPSRSDGSPADECVTVTAALMTPTITTTALGSSIALGESAADKAIVTGVPGAVAPSGTVTFSVCGPETSVDCTTGRQVGSPVVLSFVSGASSGAMSASFEPPEAGTYCFSAVYSGDDNYAAISDDSSLPAECFTVTAASGATGAPRPSTAPLPLPSPTPPGHRGPPRGVSRCRDGRRGREGSP
jgi:hypothetical protein